jgi:hypothetical protein
MYAIRHYAVTLAGLAIIGGIAGFGPALWTAAGLLVSIGANSLANFQAERNTDMALRQAKKQMASGAGRESVVKALEPGGFATALVSMSIIGSLLLAVASAVVLFIRYGWLPMMGFIVLFIVYFAVRATDQGRTRRLVVRLRTTLSSFVAQREAGLVTDEQLLTRSFDALDHGLSADVRRIPGYYDGLLAPAGMAAGRHQTLLRVLATYLETTEEHAVRYSELHQAVRQQLDLPEHP